MRRVTLVCLLLLPLACAAPKAAPPKAYGAVVGDLKTTIVQALTARGHTRLAILPLAAEGDVAESAGTLVLDELAATLSNTAGVDLVERDKLKAVIAEMALQQSGLVKEEDELQTGKLAGAEVLLTVRATRLEDSVQLSARLVDVAEGRALAGATLAISIDDDLTAAIEDANARRNIRTSKEVLAALEKVRAGELADAEEFFEPLSKETGERRSVGLLGLAAVALGRGQLSHAKEECELSQKESNAPTYCWVIEAQIAHRHGELDKAAELAARAVHDSAVLVDWQKSIAANVLGMVQLAKNDVPAALASYKHAVALDPANGDALSNQARILEEKGDLASAVALYQQGLKADPNDKVLALLLRDAEGRLAFAKDAAQQKKIATLASELVSHKKSGEAQPRDRWTSTPLSLTVLPWSEKGAPASRVGETAFLESSVRSQLDELAGVELVDRELLTHVLGELQLGTSALSDNKTALEVGRIVSARVLIDGNIVRMGEEAQVTLKLIETETTRILASVSAVFEAGTRATDVAQALGEKLSKKLGQLFPLRARVVSAAGKRVELNIGTRAGATVGDAFTLLAPSDAKVLGEGTLVKVEPSKSWLELSAAGNNHIPKQARAERNTASH